MRVSLPYTKLKAGALQYTLFVAIIIAIIMLALIQMSYYSASFSKRVQFISNLHYELNNKLNSYLNNLPGLAKTKDIKIKKSHWGNFELITGIISAKNYTFKKPALIGGYTKQTDRIALYLVDTHSPLVMAGQAQIIGNVFLPGQGLKRGSVGGESFLGDSLMEGNRKKSFTVFPDIIHPPEYPTNFEKMGIQHLASDSLSVSFLEKTQWFYSKDTIYLNNLTLTGNIIIESGKAIIVDHQTNFNDIILIAPDITLFANTSLQGQLIATSSIRIGNNCNLRYPSALYLNADNEKSRISIAKSTHITGAIIYNTGLLRNDYNPAVLIEKGVTVNGEVFSKKNIELYGEIDGSVYTKKFVVHSGSVYDNHLYNGIIDVKKLYKYYTGLITDKSQKRIIKWLY